jgi:hypothetical protein
MANRTQRRFDRDEVLESFFADEDSDSGNKLLEDNDEDCPDVSDSDSEWEYHSSEGKDRNSCLYNIM